MLLNDFLLTQNRPPTGYPEILVEGRHGHLAFPRVLEELNSNVVF